MKKKINLIHSGFNRQEDGQIIILFVLFFVLIAAAGIGSLDYGTYIHSRQKLEVAVDAAALAGALELPASTSEAISIAEIFISKNIIEIDPANVTTSFFCLLGDRDNDGSPDAEDIPAVCDPGSFASWTCEDERCLSPCNPDDGVCNTMGVSASQDIPLVFTRIMGLPPAQITASRTGACRGLCGDPHGGAIDVIIVLDRTGSMAGSDLENAKDGALAVLEIFDPVDQHVGLAVLGAGVSGDHCEVASDGSGNWLVVPLSNDYQNGDGTVNESSLLVQTIRCLKAGGWTNLGSPIYDQEYGRPNALIELLNSGRPVPKGMIVLSDGEANRPNSNSGCQYADSMATIAKNHGVEIFTIGYGVDGLRCSTHEPGVYDYMRVTTLLGRMASDSDDDQGHCDTQSEIDDENADGDHFLCQPRGGDLETVFTIAATALSSNIKLVQYPE